MARPNPRRPKPIATVASWPLPGPQHLGLNRIALEFGQILASSGCAWSKAPQRVRNPEKLGDVAPRLALRPLRPGQAGFLNPGGESVPAMRREQHSRLLQSHGVSHLRP